MQLKLRRSQREGGIVATNVIFCLDARAELTDQERRNLSRYKLYGQVIYNSEASRRHLDKGDASADGSTRGALKSLVHVAMAALHLNITVRGLEKGQHIECKSLDELIAAEDAIMEACQNLKAYLDIAATFDGSEMVIDFLENGPQVVAQAIRPEPILAPPPLSFFPAATAALAAPDTFTAHDVPEVYATPSGDDEYRSAPNAVVWWISQATALPEEVAKTALIAAPVIALILLVAMCHG